MDHHLSLPSPRLPSEICDYILDHLWDNHKTLQICSLVTREWLPKTRKHLFHSIHIFSNTRRVAFEDVILQSGDALALCVRKLNLMLDELEGGCPVSIPSLPRILAPLGRLEELTLCVSTWDDCYFSTEPITWPELPAVKALHLHVPIVNDVVSLQRFICACPLLSSLELRIVLTSNSDDSHAHPPTVIPRSIVIETFQCTLRKPDPVVRWMLQGGLKLRIRRLAIDRLTSISHRGTGDTQGLLRASGECLEHLVVNLALETLSASPDGQQASALAHNPNLVSIYMSTVLRDPVSFYASPYPSSWRTLLSILADIQPMHTKLQSIDITLVTTFEPDITSMPCEQLDAALARIVDIHPRLVFTVWIECTFLKPTPRLAEFVGALLQRLVRVQAARGRLCLMWLNDYDENRDFSHRTTPSWCSR
ncbi:uncharacterized protein LAESUDRAFT_89935 [Laetiporus sulphureus 93-53]|uniref:F-box domain-containing protein n=1 Tax=Laetiporus sulphureus 93-53 TaxID=1314785 RepID=A0A165EY74_9APHY|nr:uncharacterized protein LAESUDRAFT_89935 [Laetiporus sulphureus 93-53]KZT07966.1 hypothetical protein LAESUDRAFT_89935 [Laetiporus sulphureus 93-53]